MGLSGATNEVDRWQQCDDLLQLRPERAANAARVRGFVRLLDLLRDDARFAPAVARALSFIGGSQNADGSWGADGDPYETALAVTATASHPAYAAATQRGVEHLLTSMTADGSWTSQACIWEFHADERDVWRAYDVHGTFVSARCSSALRRAAGQLAPFP